MKRMRKRYFIFIAVAVVVAILVIVNLKARERRSLAVQTEEVAKRDLTMVISASGSVRPKRKVDISASSIGKVTKVAVKEGEVVQKGQFLLQIDPVELETTVARIRAMHEAAKSNEKQAVAQAEQAKNDYERSKTLLEGGHRTMQEVETAKTNYDVSVARLEAVRQEIAQYRANLESAQHSLKEVTIVSPMSGIVTRRNVEEGEIAIMGTLNNLGTVLLTIADLSTIETEIEVDETEVTHMKIGDRAKVTLDAFPDTSFAGEVTEIGNSPIVSGASAAQQGVDFKVVVTIDGSIPNVCPGLSADAEITVAEAKGAHDSDPEPRPRGEQGSQGSTRRPPTRQRPARRKRPIRRRRAAPRTARSSRIRRSRVGGRLVSLEIPSSPRGEALDRNRRGAFRFRDGDLGVGRQTGTHVRYRAVDRDDDLEIDPLLGRRSARHEMGLFPISVTSPANDVSGNASSVTFALSPIFICVTSVSSTSISVSIVERSAIVRSTVPRLLSVPMIAISPSSTLRRVTIPDIGETIVTSLRLCCALSRFARYWAISCLTASRRATETS